jgi:serine/threonine protein kinase
MAPEVYRHENYNETVDIYSYSMILYYLFVGRPPWAHLPGDEAVRLAAELGDRPTLPRNMDNRLVALLKDCWDDNPSCRPPFSIILDSLASYVRSVFHVNTNNEVISSTLQYDEHNSLSKRGCCTIM